MKHFRTLVLLGVVGLLAAGIAVYYGWLPNPWSAKTDTSGGGAAPGMAGATDEPEVLRVLGWVEPAQGTIDINGPPGDRLESLALVDGKPLEEGQTVEKGQVLATLESRPLKQQQVDLLASQVEEAIARRTAESQLAETRVQAAKLGKEKVELQDLEAKSLAEKIRLLQANLELAQKDLARLNKLRAPSPSSALADEIVSQQDVERQQLVVHRAQTELDAAKSDLERLQKGHELSVKLADADYDAAVAAKNEAIAAVPVKSLEDRLKIAKAELEIAQIKAPSKGTVLKIFVHPGESIGQKPILRMGNLDKMVAAAEVYEVDAKRLDRGQTAVIRSPAFHAPHDKDGLRGKLLTIGRVINTPELKSINPFARVDRHVIPVRIELDKEGCGEAARYVNLQVDVEIRVR
ncbi:MAG: HlyD family efflux transporter periplasmic adaptor subunit [Thermoguttaceae bacterium]